MEAIIALALFAVLTICVLVGIWRTLRKRGPAQPASNLDAIPPSKPDPEDDPIFRISLVIIAVAGLILTMLPDARGADPAPQKPIVLKLSDCPPPGPGMTPIVAFIVNTESDLGKASSTCVRFASRPLQPTRPQKQKSTRTITSKE